MDTQMTVFYNTRTGTIKGLVGGAQDMTIYGTEQIDYELIYSFIVVPFDNYVFQNFNSFNVVLGELKIIEGSIPTQYLTTP
jgi:hypothetical protein